MKRKQAEWGFEKALKNTPDGVSVESPIQLNEDTIILRVKHRDDISIDEIKGLQDWVVWLKKKLPKNVFILTTPKSLDVSVERPLQPMSLEINFERCTVDDGFWAKMQQEINSMDGNVVQATVNFRDSHCSYSNVQVVGEVEEDDIQQIEPTARVTTLGLPPQPAASLDKKQELEELHKVLSSRQSKIEVSATEEEKKQGKCNVQVTMGAKDDNHR